MNDALKNIAAKRADNNYVSDNNTKNYGLVIPRLYVGSLAAAQTAEILARLEISYVLTAAGRLNVGYPHDTPISHLVLDDLPDHPMADLLAELPRALEFLDQALLSPQQDQRRGGVLVHCASGVSRSVAVCCAWLMTRRQLSYDDALAQVRVNRPQACPNVGFRTQLLALQECRGDIIKAQALHNERFHDNSVTDIIRTQREKACSLHEEVDNLENRMQDQSSGLAVERDEKKLWLKQLLDMQLRMDVLAAEMNEFLEDRPARSMRKSASEKVARLIADIEQC